MHHVLRGVSIVVHFNFVVFAAEYLIQNVAYVCHILSDLVKAFQR